MINSKFKHVSDNMAHNKHRAKFLQRTLGTTVAAGYLRNRGYSVEFAVLVLTNRF